MSKSDSIVSFIANLMPIYVGERHGDHWCAREVERGVLVSPLPGEPDDDPWVCVAWNHPDATTEIPAEIFASVALVRYVQFHATGHPMDVVAQELHFLSQHFEFKTGCALYLPSLPEEPTLATKVARTATKMGQGLLTALISRVSTGGL